MAIEQGATNQFKVGLPLGQFDFSTDTFKIALYTGAATLDATTAAYTTTGEVVGTGYVAGGQVLSVSVQPTMGSNPTNEVAYMSFADVSWDPAAFTARGALVYKVGAGNPTLFVLDFGGDKTATTVFSVQFPPADSANAIVRIN